MLKKNKLFKKVFYKTFNNKIKECYGGRAWNLGDANNFLGNSIKISHYTITWRFQCLAKVIIWTENTTVLQTILLKCEGDGFLIRDRNLTISVSFINWWI